MKKYDDNEKIEKQNQDFVKVLNEDEKMKSLFLQNYNPGSDATDDDKYVSFVFSMYSE